VTRESAEGGDVFVVEGNSRRFLEYNKNIAIHHFIDASIEAAVRGAEGDAAGNGCDRDATQFIADLLEQEFLFDPAAASVVREEEAAVLASLVESCLECYMIAARACAAFPPKDKEVPRQDVVENCLSTGERMLEEGAVRRPESVSKTATMNAIRRFVLMDALRQRREKVEGRADRVFISGGEELERLSQIETRLKLILENRRRTSP
jgi:glycerol-3-phosphate O-acyltransferase